jgi:hypothetical protein
MDLLVDRDECCGKFPRLSHCSPFRGACWSTRYYGASFAVWIHPATSPSP